MEVRAVQRVPSHSCYELKSVNLVLWSTIVLVSQPYGFLGGCLVEQADQELKKLSAPKSAKCTTKRVEGNLHRSFIRPTGIKVTGIDLAKLDGCYSLYGRSSVFFQFPIMVVDANCRSGLVDQGDCRALATTLTSRGMCAVIIDSTDTFLLAKSAPSPFGERSPTQNPCRTYGNFKSSGLSGSTLVTLRALAMILSHLIRGKSPSSDCNSSSSQKTWTYGKPVGLVGVLLALFFAAKSLCTFLTMLCRLNLFFSSGTLSRTYTCLDVLACKLCEGFEQGSQFCRRE